MIMNNDEKQFEDFINDIKFDDTPNINHRDALEKDLLAALSGEPRQKHQRPNIWRIIMNSKTAKLTAAAAIIIIAAIMWISSGKNIPPQISSFSLLSQASAAEQKLFYGTSGILHIANEIILYPEIEGDVSWLLDNLELDTTQDNNIAFIKGWMSYRWIPIYSLGADSQLREHKLEIAEQTDNAVIIHDLTWYDPVNGYFARVLKKDDQVIFANAYDGKFIYITNKEPDKSLEIDKESVISTFKVPENPADFLGIAAGIKSSIPGEHYPPIQNVTTETLEDGTSVRNYKLGFKDLWGKTESYFLLTTEADNDVINKIECVIDGKTSRIHQRLITETIESPELSWNLSELNISPTGTSAAVKAGTGSSIITIQQMAQLAVSTAYIFSKDPSWTTERKIYDLPDETSAPDRMLCVTYRAKDGRDIVLTQGESFNRYFSTVFNKIMELGEQIPWTYESENGFKMMHQNDRDTELWWTEFAIKSSGFEPHANRVGYILMSPENTFMVLAINGPASESELNELIDSLIPAAGYIPNSIHP